MINIECPVCGHENDVRDDDEEPICELCGSSLEPIEDDCDDEKFRRELDEIPF